MSAFTLVVGVGGPSGSGKTTLCRAIRARLGDDACSVLEMDRYYRDLSDLAPHDREACDFDAPDALDVPCLVHQVRRLGRGEPVEVPHYDFVTHTRAGASELVPGRVLLVEGIFCLVYEELRELLDWSVFVYAPDPVCLERRLARDVDQRGRSEEQVLAQYHRFVRPASERIVIPSARHANRILTGTFSVDELCGTVLDDLAAFRTPPYRPPRRDAPCSPTRSSFPV